MPTIVITEAELAEEARLIAWMAKAGMTKSNGEARKAVQQGGVYVGDEKITDPDYKFTADQLSGDGVLVKKGKKTFQKFHLA